MPPLHPFPRASLDSPAERYFAALEDAYALAAAAAGEEILDLAVGPWTLRTHFGSSSLLQTLLPPIERLIADGRGAPDVVVRAWDTASTGVRVPPFPWSPADVGPGGVVSGYDGGRFRTLYRDEEAGFHSLAMFDSVRRVAYFWFAGFDQINWYERAEPLRAAIHWAFGSERCFLAHASAVGDRRGAVLLTGKGGAGKTTTTLACIDRGLRFIGDNYVLVALDPDREPVVYGLYGTAKLWPQTLEQLPVLAPYVRTFATAPDEKLVVDVTRYAGDRLATRLPIRAVMNPVLAGGGRARVVRCTPVDTLLALAPTTLLQLPRTERGLDGMAALVRAVPTYRLELGDTVSSGPEAISALLDEVGAGQ